MTGGVYSTVHGYIWICSVVWELGHPLLGYTEPHWACTIEVVILTLQTFVTFLFIVTVMMDASASAAVCPAPTS